MPTVEIPLSAVNETAVFDKAQLAAQIDSRPEAPIFDPVAAASPSGRRPKYRRKKSKPWLAIGFTIALGAALIYAAYALNAAGPTTVVVP